MKQIKIKLAAFLIITLCFSLGAFVGKVYKPVVDAAPLASTALFGGPSLDGTVTDIEVSENIAYLGGNFSSVGYESAYGAVVNNTTGLLVSGQLAIDDTVLAIALDGDGGYYIGGNFTSVAGETRNYLAHIESDGSLDESWDPDPDDIVRAIAVSGSDVYVAGDFENIGGESIAGLAKLNNTTGVADPAWDPSPDGYVNVITISGSDIYVGGHFENIGGLARNYAAKLNTGNDNADATWNPAPDDFVTDIAISDPHIYIVGGFGNIGGQARNFAAKLNNTNGNADATWNPNPDIRAVFIKTLDSDVYVAGHFFNIGGQSRTKIAKLNNTNGNANLAWETPEAEGYDGGIYSLGVSDSGIYFGADFTSIGGQEMTGIAKFDNSTGDLDTDWNPRPDSYEVNAIALSGSNVYVGGAFESIGGEPRGGLAAIDLTTNLLTDWNPNVSGEVARIAISGSSLYVGGEFTSVGGEARNNIAKVDLDTGEVDATWDADANGDIEAIVISGSSIYVSGGFTTIGGLARDNVAKLNNTNGDADAAFDMSTYFNGFGNFNSLDILDSYLYLVTSSAVTIDLIQYRSLYRVDRLTGEIDTSWAGSCTACGGADAYYVKVVSPYIYVGGSFNTYQAGAPSGGLVRLNLDGSIDDTWTPASDDRVLAVDVSGPNVFVGGPFDAIGGQSRDKLAKLNNTSGSADLVWNPSPGGRVEKIVIYGSSVLVGGNFSGGLKRYDFPTVSFSSSSSSGNENTASPSLVVNLSTASDINTTITYSTSGTATSGSDYSAGAGSVTINAGQTSASLPITVTQDEITEGGETIEITITDPGSAFLGATTTHTYTIDQNDQGSGIPAGNFAQPSGPDGNPSIPYTLKINDNALSTNKADVTLTFDGGDDIGSMAISNKQGLSDASIEPYTATKQWNLCSGLDTCVSGAYTVYAKLYTKNGQQPSSIFSDGISLETSSVIEPPKTGEPIVEIPPIINQGSDVLTRNIKRRDTGPDIKILQQFLNNHGFILANSSWGSPGNETEYFGPRTQRALTRFQRAYIGTVKTVTGSLNDLTRNLINLLSKN